MLRRNTGWPHEGRELQLMLSGRKKLAVFCENSPSDERMVSTAIPEEAFAPYVARGRIIRLEASVFNADENCHIRFVCFTLPGSEWRAQTFFWIKREVYGGSRMPDAADEVMIARLLGYSFEEITEFKRTFAGAAVI